MLKLKHELLKDDQEHAYYFFDPELLKEPPDIFELFTFYNQFFFSETLATSIV